jgi:hypothetical protein
LNKKVEKFFMSKFYYGNSKHWNAPLPLDDKKRCCVLGQQRFKNLIIRIQLRQSTCEELLPHRALQQSNETPQQ